MTSCVDFREALPRDCAREVQRSVGWLVAVAVQYNHSSTARCPGWVVRERPRLEMGQLVTGWPNVVVIATP